MADGPKQRKPRKSEQKEPYREFRFLNHSLTSEQKDELRSMDTLTEFPASLVEELVSAGYKYSLSLDERNQSFVASLTDRDKASPFYNVCLTGRGSTADNARCALLYRHVYLAQGDWSALSTVSGNDLPDYG